MRCPRHIIQFRMAVARTSIMKCVRRQKTHFRHIAIGSLALMMNIPCGYTRELFPKFSPGWFVSVHAVVPIVAAMRKGANLPWYAVFLSIAMSVYGQHLGAMLA